MVRIHEMEIIKFMIEEERICKRERSFLLGKE